MISTSHVIATIVISVRGLLAERVHVMLTAATRIMIVISVRGLLAERAHATLTTATRMIILLNGAPTKVSAGLVVRILIFSTGVLSIEGATRVRMVTQDVLIISAATNVERIILFSGRILIASVASISTHSFSRGASVVIIAPGLSFTPKALGIVLGVEASSTIALV